LKRGGSKLLNQFAPVGYQEKSVWGYLLGCDETQDEYTESFLPAVGGVASASAYSADADHVVDELPATNWQAKDSYAWSTSLDTDRTTIRCSIYFLGALLVGTYGDSTVKIFRLKDDIWTEVFSKNSDYGIRQFAIHNGKVYAVSGSALGVLLESTNGVSWAVKSTVTANALNSVISHLDKIWVTKAMNNGLVLNSADNGASWTTSLDPTVYGSHSLIVFKDELFVACDLNTYTTKNFFIYKFNGTSWSIKYTSDTGIHPVINSAIVWNDKLFFGISGGRILSSSDGITFTLSGDLFGGTGSVQSFVEYNGKLLAGVNALMYESEDGETWTLFPDYNGMGEALVDTMISFKWDVFSQEYLFVGTGNAGKVRLYQNVLSYTDNWIKYALPAAKHARKIAITPFNSGVRLFTLYGSNDDATYTSIYSSICDEGNVRQEFLLPENASYLYHKLVINTAHGDHFAGVTEWELMELTASADMNYYIFENGTAKDIIRKVVFPSLQSMLNFVSYWKAKNTGWETDYYCVAANFDMDDTTSIATDLIVSFSTYTLAQMIALIDSKINERMSVFALLRDEENNELFGVPQAWKVMSESTAITSMHELKRRNLRQVYTYDEDTGVLAGEDAEPKEYIQNKFVFATADNAILTANQNTDLTIHGFNVIKTGLKRGANCCWVNFQNRAFMVNGAEDDCDMVWTDGENVFDIGITSPATAPTDAANAATGGYMADGEYYFKYLYHRTTYGANNSGFSPEVKVTLALGKGEIETFTFTGGTGYAVGQILTAVQSGASGGTFRVDTVDAAGVILSLSQLDEGALYSIANGLATTVNVGGGSAATISVLTITDVAKTQKETFNVLPSSDPQVDKIYLYRTKLNDYVFYKCAEIDNVYDPLNPATTLPISSTSNDNSLAVGDLADDEYGTPPQSKFIAVGGNKMWYATENAVYHSKKNFPEDVPAENYIPVNEDDGEKIMGICVVNTWLLVFKETKTFAIDVNEPMAVAPIMISDTLGLVSYKTLSVAEGQVAIWISQVGPCVSNGTSVLIISKGRANDDDSVIGKIYDDFANNFDHSKNSEAFAMYYPKRQQYWFHVPYLGGYYRTWIYDVQTSSFYKYSFPIEAENYILLTDDDNTQRLISTFTKIDTAKYYGYIMIYDEETYQDTSAITLAGVETKTDITMDIITAWSSLGIAERIKSFRMIYAEVYAAAAASLTISCGIDHKRMENKQILLNGLVSVAVEVGVVPIYVVGVGTYFLTELKVLDRILIDGVTKTVATITDNTHLTVAEEFSVPLSSVPIYKIGPGIHTAIVAHPGEVGTAPTVGKDEIEGYDYGRVRSLPSPVDGVGTYFSIRLQHTGSMALTLFGYTMMFRLRGARP
jgi:hypothetical protein